MLSANCGAKHAKPSCMAGRAAQFGQIQSVLSNGIRQDKHSFIGVRPPTASVDSHLADDVEEIGLNGGSRIYPKMKQGQWFCYAYSMAAFDPLGRMTDHVGRRSRSLTDKPLGSTPEISTFSPGQRAREQSERISCDAKGPTTKAHSPVAQAADTHRLPSVLSQIFATLATV